MMCEDPTMRPSRTYLEMGMAVGHDKDARSSGKLLKPTRGLWNSARPGRYVSAHGDATRREWRVGITWTDESCPVPPFVGTSRSDISSTCL